MSTERQVYRSELLKLDHGLPVYEPDPAGEYDKVRVGDVGYEDRFGRFHRVFNVFLPAEDPINTQRGTPRDFSPLGSQHAETFHRSALPAGAMHSTYVRILEGSFGASGSSMPANAAIKFSLRNNQGAALVIKYPAFREDVLNEGALKTYMLKNYDSWLSFIRDDLQRSITLKDIVFVTGCDLTADWATAAFVEKASHYEVEFKAIDPTSTVGGTAAFWGSWQSSMNVPLRCGPGPVRPPMRTVPNRLEYSTTPSTIFPHSETDSGPQYDQCLFLRGFRVRERALRAPRIIKAAADPGNMDMDREDDLTPIITSLEQGSDSDECEDGDVHCSRVHSLHDALLNFVLEKMDSDIAIIHDRDVCHIAKNLQDSRQGFTLDAISQALGDRAMSYFETGSLKKVGQIFASGHTTEDFRSPTELPLIPCENNSKSGSEFPALIPYSQASPSGMPTSDAFVFQQQPIPAESNAIISFGTDTDTYLNPFAGSDNIDAAYLNMYISEQDLKGFDKSPASSANPSRPFPEEIAAGPYPLPDLTRFDNSPASSANPSPPYPTPSYPEIRAAGPYPIPELTRFDKSPASSANPTPSYPEIRAAGPYPLSDLTGFDGAPFRAFNSYSSEELDLSDNGFGDFIRLNAFPEYNGGIFGPNRSKYGGSKSEETPSAMYTTLGEIATGSDFQVGQSYASMDFEGRKNENEGDTKSENMWSDYTASSQSFYTTSNWIDSCNESTSTNSQYSAERTSMHIPSSYSIPQYSESDSILGRAEHSYTSSETATTPVCRPNYQLESWFLPGPLVPPSQSDWKHHVDDTMLKPSIYFHRKDLESPGIVKLGVSLADCMSQRFSHMYEPDEGLFADGDSGPSISIRIVWHGYEPWSHQIPTRNFKAPPGPTTRSQLARDISRSVMRFVDEHNSRTMEEGSQQCWRLGPGNIEFEHLVLLSIHNVCEGSWQVNLCLDRSLEDITKMVTASSTFRQ